jgi:hypothetical protein
MDCQTPDSAGHAANTLKEALFAGQLVSAATETLAAII